jgi:hypothetical protein
MFWQETNRFGRYHHENETCLIVGSQYHVRSGLTWASFGEVGWNNERVRVSSIIFRRGIHQLQTRVFHVLATILARHTIRDHWRTIWLVAFTSLTHLESYLDLDDRFVSTSGWVSDRLMCPKALSSSAFCCMSYRVQLRCYQNARRMSKQAF